MTDRTVGLAEIIREAIRGTLLETHTCIPATVEKYNREKQTASVQPSIKRKYSNGSTINLPIIQNVPVQFPKAGDFFIHYDLVKGDNVILVFSERSIDNWFKKGGTVESGDSRIHSLTDAFAIPGCSPEPKSFTPTSSEGDFEIKNKDGSIIVSKDGKVSISNNENEVMALMVELLTEMIAGKNLTSVGPLGKDPNYLAKLNEIKTKMEGFVL